jgi:hypothetical protein
MAFDPFSSSSRDFYGQSRFSDLVGRQASTKVGLIGDAVANKSYILAAKRSAKYQKEMMDYQAKLARSGRPSTGSQIGGSIAGAAAGAAISAGVALV